MPSSSSDVNGELEYTYVYMGICKHLYVYIRTYMSIILPTMSFCVNREEEYVHVYMCICKYMYIYMYINEYTTADYALLILLRQQRDRVYTCTYVYI